MKVMIFSLSAGGGHAQASEAIKKNIMLKNKNSEVIIVDTLKYINPIINKVVVGGYIKSLKVSPSLYGKIYKRSEVYDGIATSISSVFNEAMTFKILPLINQVKPDVLICTHAFPTEMASILKGKNKIDIPCISIITDYYSHNMWLHPNIDGYTVSNQDMIEDLISKGIDKDTIHNLGIPVTPEFLVKYDKAETLRELNFRENIPTILVMGGSLGMGKIKSIYKELMKVKKDIQIIVITGNNKKLYSELESIKESSNKDTRIIGFTDKVNRYMQACDLLLTKPGGLTIAESLICGIPLVLFSPIPGQEEKNAEFLLKHSLAVNIDAIDNCSGIIENLLSDEPRLTKMKLNCKDYSKPNAGGDIYNLINSLIHKNRNNKPLKKSMNFLEINTRKDEINSFFKNTEKHLIKTAKRFYYYIGYKSS
jgi:processive 1,2-diacylglycerol beta-glucosyltransferase